MSGKEQLHALESEDKYVFHGSENRTPDLNFLEPRQAYNTKDGIQEHDGDPAVFASSRADYAIMMALINNSNCPKGYRSSASSKQKENGELFLTLRTSKDSFLQLNDESFGYVYVFDKNLFQRKGSGVEYISKVTISPINKIKVMKSDLSSDIDIF